MLNQYIQLLEAGEIVAFPTETVYGLGADAWNPSAIRKVFDQKGRPADNPLIVHVSSIPAVKDFAQAIPADAHMLMEAFWPGPLTLIFKKKREVLDLLTGGLDTVAIRWPSHPLAEDLITSTGPLVAPSANSSGRPSPTKAEHIWEDFGKNFPVIDAGETVIGLESTVLDVSQEPYQIYRPGKITLDQIQHVADKTVIHADEDKESQTKSPGTKYTHYTPDATVRWLNPNEKIGKENTLYLLHSNSTTSSTKNIIQYACDLNKLAHELYDRFRQADHAGFKIIAIEHFPDKAEDNLIPALTNRIEKAIG